MPTAPSPDGRRWKAAALRLTLALAAVLPGLGAAACGSASAAAPDSAAGSPPGEATSFVSARDAYESAHALYRSAEYAQAQTELDGALRSLNYVLTNSRDRTIRKAAADLHRRVGSLRLACTRAMEKERERLILIGPPLPPELAREREDARAAAAEEAAVVAEADSVPGIGEADAESEAPGGIAEAPAELVLDAAAMVPEIEPVQNSRVRKWVEFYTGRGRTTFEKWLRRSGLYMEWMKEILRSEGLPTDLVHLVFVESGFNPQARSRSHAVGPWQFIRGTAKLFGLKVDRWVDERKDPELATQAAARYLKHLYALFDSWPLALASYNAGEGAVVRAISRQGTNDFWQLKLPKQTREYVPQFLACLSIAREPARYGFDTVEPEPRLEFDTVHLPGPVDLKAVAAACGASLDSLRALNPAFLRTAAPVGPTGVVTLRVPSGTGDQLLAGLESGAVDLPQVQTPPEPTYLRHKVRRGESLSTVAHRYRVTIREIAEANDLSPRAHLRIGQVLRVPNRDALVAARPPRPSAGGSVPVYGGVKTIRIEPGDTLGGIAQRYGTDVKTLRALNNLRPRQHIRAGGKLKVPVPADGG